MRWEEYADHVALSLVLTGISTQKWTFLALNIPDHRRHKCRCWPGGGGDGEVRDSLSGLRSSNLNLFAVDRGLGGEGSTTEYSNRASNSAAIPISGSTSLLRSNCNSSELLSALNKPWWWDKNTENNLPFTAPSSLSGSAWSLIHALSPEPLGHLQQLNYHHLGAEALRRTDWTSRISFFFACFSCDEQADVLHLNISQSLIRILTLILLF